MNPARQPARAAIQAVRSAQVDEPTIEYRGRRYGESELRRLQDAGQLARLGILAAGVPLFLRQLATARRPAFGRPNHLFVTEFADSRDGLPHDCEYLLPSGWKLTRIQIEWTDNAEDSDALAAERD